jgi:hypothetical protein
MNHSGFFSATVRTSAYPSADHAQVEVDMRMVLLVLALSAPCSLVYADDVAAQPGTADDGACVVIDEARDTLARTTGPAPFCSSPGSSSWPDSVSLPTAARSATRCRTSNWARAFS